MTRTLLARPERVTQHEAFPTGAHPAGERQETAVSQRAATEVEIVGWEPQESAALMERLRAHLADPRFAYRHRWSVGDIVFWDSQATVHARTPFPAEIPARAQDHRPGGRAALLSHRSKTMSQTRTLLASRYGRHPSLPAIASNEVLDHLLSHRSVRAYTAEPLAQGTLEALVAAAQSAASSSNLQLWSVVVVEDGERRRRLAELAGNQAHIVQAPLFLVWLADHARLRRIAAQRGIAAEGLDYLEMYTMAVVDAALAAQNAVVAAESLGLGTVYIGAMRNQPEQVAAELGLPPGVFAVFGLCVGHPAALPAIKPRLPQNAVLHRETYALESQDAAVERYDAAMSEFYAEQNMAVSGDWSKHSAVRISSPAKLSGRDRLKAALNALGFELR
jgi:nitroreductase